MDRQVDGAGIDQRSGCYGHGHGLAGDQTGIDFAVALSTRPSTAKRSPPWSERACRHELTDRRRAGGASGWMTVAADASQAQQIGGGAGRARAHALVEEPADQQEEQQRDGRIEVDLSLPRWSGTGSWRSPARRPARSVRPC